MTSDRTHDEIRSLLAAAALQTLEGDDLAIVSEHVAGCDECGQILSEQSTVVTHLLQLLADEPFDRARSVAIRARLLARATAAPHASLRRVAERWAGWGVAASLTGFLLMHHGFHHPIAYGWIVAGSAIFVSVILAGVVLAQRIQLKTLRHHQEDAQHSSV